MKKTASAAWAAFQRTDRRQARLPRGVPAFLPLSVRKQQFPLQAAVKAGIMKKAPCRRLSHSFWKGACIMTIPDPNVVFPNEYKTSCFLKNVITAPNITVGDYTYYDDSTDPTGFERNNVLFNYPEFGDKLTIGKFCMLASGTKFIMGPANHRLCSVTAYPFAVFGGIWAERTPPHLSQLPHKGDTVVGSDVWIGRESVIMPGVHIGDGAIIAAYSVVTKDIPPYTLWGGNPARFIKDRFDQELTALLLRFRWWDLDPRSLAEVLPLLCDPDLEKVKAALAQRLED